MSRRYTYLILALALVGAILLASVYILKLGQPSPDPTALTYYTEQFPPYNYQESDTLKGVAVDLLGEITGKMGKTVMPNQVHLVPWTEGYQATLNSNNTVLFSTVRLPERETSFKWAGPILTDSYVLFAGWDRGITINSLDNLSTYRIGVITDDAAIPQLLDAGVEESQLIYDTNASVLIGKLSSGEIDLWCYPEAVGRSITEQVTGNYYSFKVVFTLDNIGYYYAFSKDVPDSTVNAFQQAIDALKQERDTAGVSTYDRVLGRYIPSIGLGQLNYLTEEWAPFNYEKEGKPAGLSVEILEAIFRTIGVNRTGADVRIVTLADGFTQAQGNTGTMLFSIVRTPERESLYKWAGPFTKSSFVVFAPVSRNVTIASDADLNSYVIGAVESTIENDLLAQKGYNVDSIINRETPAELAQMLRGGQVDLWATGDLTGPYEMKQAGVNPDDNEIVYVLSKNEFYYIFSKDIPDTLINAFSGALDNVRHQRDAQGVTEYARIVYRNLGVGYARQTFTDETVVALVDKTVTDIHNNAADTFRKINAGEAPYQDIQDPGLYVFVYDTNVTMIAHGDNILMVGSNWRGKTDVTGFAFRDAIVNGALENGSGWVEYVYFNPSQANLYYKTTYYKLATGSDDNKYVVCCGNYRSYG